MFTPAVGSGGGSCFAFDNHTFATRSPSIASTRILRPSTSIDVADARAASQPAEHVAADRRVGVFVDVQPELLVDVADQREAVDVGRAVAAHDCARLRAHLARNLADDALHQRLERDQARGAAVLVDDERLAHAAPPHLRRADRWRRA